MYPLTSAKCHELDWKVKVGSVEGPRAERATHAVYNSAVGIVHFQGDVDGVYLEPQHTGAEHHHGSTRDFGHHEAS